MKHDYLINWRGGVVAVDERTAIARAALGAIVNPIGIETIDWEIADAVIALRRGPFLPARMRPLNRKFIPVRRKQ